MIFTCVAATFREGVDVCVIGAGPSGVQAAYTAEEKGLTTALFEKNMYIGGKTKTVLTNSPVPYAMGAALYNIGEYQSLQDLLDKFNVSPSDVAGTPRTFYDKNGQTVPSPPPTYELMAGIQKYVAIRGALANDLDNPSGLMSDYNPNLNVSLMQWLIDNDLLVLYPLFWFYFTTYGYGHPSDVPAVFPLKYLPSQYFLDFVNINSGSSWRYLNFQSLLEKMALSLAGPVFLSTEIEHVAYGSKHNIIKYRVGECDLQSMKCGSTIIAFPPTTSAMMMFTPPKVKDALTGLFGEVKTFSYHTYLYKDEGDFAQSRAAAYRLPEVSSLPDMPAENLLYFKQQFFNESSVVAYYLSPSAKSSAEAMEESMESYGKKIGENVTADLIEDSNDWVYFPHVSKDSLDGAFYSRFNEFQGDANQYYVGGLFNFETVQGSMTHAKFILDEFF